MIADARPVKAALGRYRRGLRRAYYRSELAKYALHIAASVVIGLAAGLGAVLFHFLLEGMRHLFVHGTLHRRLTIDDTIVVIIPVLGSALCASMTRYFPDIAREKGVVSVIKAIILNNGLIKLRVTLFHLLAPIISMGTGAPLGPEGPAAKIGSGIGSFMSQVLRFSRDDMMMYTAAGGGAAIAAVFNAPITGVFFGIEVLLLNDLKNRALSALIIASVVADILSRALLGNVQVLTIPRYVTGGIETYPFFLIFGLVAGGASILYFMLSDAVRAVIDKKLGISNHYARLLPVALVFGFVLLKNPEHYGIGNSPIGDVKAGTNPIMDAPAILVLKVLFVALFLGAGSYGGTFAPSLSIGAFLGFIFATALSRVTGFSLDPAAFALVGMGGVLAGITSAPLTAIMIVFEITNDYAFILPLMLVSILSYLVTVYYNRGTVYSRELLHEGIDVSKRNEADILGKITVSKLMRDDFDRVSFRTPFKNILDTVMNSRYGDIIVVDDRGGLMGIISLRNIRQAIADHDLVDLLIAYDLMQPVNPVYSDDPLSQAIQNIEEGDFDIIPVVDQGPGARVLGALSHGDITNAYRTLLGNWKTNQYLIDYSAPGKTRPDHNK
jgi:CIC family chloride channel protein